LPEAASGQGVEVRRISYVDALSWLREAAPGEERPVVSRDTVEFVINRR